MTDIGPSPEKFERVREALALARADVERLERELAAVKLEHAGMLERDGIEGRCALEPGVDGDMPVAHMRLRALVTCPSCRATVKIVLYQATRIVGEDALPEGD